MKKERVQKLLSQAGYGSRRAIETWIKEGLVTINGQVARLGDCAENQDKICIKGKPVRPQPKTMPATRILLYHKPIGEICSQSDPDHERTVFDNIPKIEAGRWIMIGRLDINTSGLLLFTNNGELANQMMHPKFAFEREYAVRVRGEVSDAIQKRLRTGVKLDDGMANFKAIRYQGGEGTNSWYHVVLTEGKNREVRRLWESQNIAVSRLIRIRYGTIKLPHSLGRGQYRELSAHEIQALNLNPVKPERQSNFKNAEKSRNPAKGLTLQKD